MGRIVAKVTVTNPIDKTKSRTFDALVDTGAYEDGQKLEKQIIKH